jgi:hypothetical protein
MGKLKEQSSAQAAQLARINEKRQKAGKTGQKMDASRILGAVEKRTRITPEATADVLREASRGKKPILPKAFRQSALDGVEKTLDALLKK